MVTVMDVKAQVFSQTELTGMVVAVKDNLPVASKAAIVMVGTNIFWMRILPALFGAIRGVAAVRAHTRPMLQYLAAFGTQTLSGIGGSSTFRFLCAYRVARLTTGCFGGFATIAASSGMSVDQRSDRGIRQVQMARCGKNILKTLISFKNQCSIKCVHVNDIINEMSCRVQRMIKE